VTDPYLVASLCLAPSSVNIWQFDRRTRHYAETPLWNPDPETGLIDHQKSGTVAHKGVAPAAVPHPKSKEKQKEKTWGVLHARRG
jgi:hypothetical protein